MFTCEFYEISKNTLSCRALLVTASSRCSIKNRSGKFRKLYRKISLHRSIFITTLQLSLLKKRLKTLIFSREFWDVSQNSSFANTFELLLLLLCSKYNIHYLLYYIHWKFHMTFLCYFKSTSKNKWYKSNFDKPLQDIQKNKLITFRTINTPCISIIMVINVLPVVK